MTPLYRSGPTDKELGLLLPHANLARQSTKGVSGTLAKPLLLSERGRLLRRSPSKGAELDVPRDSHPAQALCPASSGSGPFPETLDPGCFGFDLPGSLGPCLGHVSQG